MSFFPPEINDDASETNEGKRYQEPPSTPPRIMQGTGEGIVSLSMQSLGVSQPFFHYHCPQGPT